MYNRMNKQNEWRQKDQFELKYNQEQFKIIQNKINVINEQQQLILNEVESLKRQVQKNKEVASDALKNSQLISQSINKVETIINLIKKMWKL